MNNLSAQSEETYKYANALLFNAWEGKPDSIILDFVKKYIPIMASKITGPWTIISPPLDPPPQIPTLHATTFKNHPFFKRGYENGEIQYLTFESNNVVDGIRDIRLILNYSDRDSGEVDFGILQQKFDNESFRKKINSNSETKFVTYFPLHEIKYANFGIQMFFYKDLIDGKKYHLLFRFQCEHEE